MNYLTEDDLQALSYSELRKVAKEKGISKRMKTNEFIKAILSEPKPLDDSFAANEQEVVNSCKKNKEDHFEKDKDTPSDTPRRDTYILSRPSDIVAETALAMTVSASPMLKSSAKKKRKVSFVTPARKSLRLINSAIKDRPKTPRNSVARRPDSISNSIVEVDEDKSPKVPKNEVPTDEVVQSEEIKSEDAVIPPTPQNAENQLLEKKDSLKSAAKDKHISSVSKAKNTPIIPKTPTLKSVENRKGTPRLLSANINLKSTERKKIISPKSSMKKKQISSLSKPKKTPKFDQIHQKAFEKMESLDEYQKRKVANSAKKLNEQRGLRQALNAKVPKANSRIPKKFGGIPFIPSVTKIQDIKTNFADLTKKDNKKTPVSNEKAAISMVKTPMGNGKSPAIKKRTPFDLKASLSRKLRYKPHAGPLKPLNHPDVKASCQSHACIDRASEKAKNKKPAVVKQKQTENVVVQAKRTEAKSFLRGVRSNKRFELQMQKRNL